MTRVFEEPRFLPLAGIELGLCSKGGRGPQLKGDCVNDALAKALLSAGFVSQEAFDRTESTKRVRAQREEADNQRNRKLARELCDVEAALLATQNLAVPSPGTAS